MEVGLGMSLEELPALVQNVNFYFFNLSSHNLFDILNSSQKSYYKYKTHSLV